FTVRLLVAAEEGSLSEDAAANLLPCERERMPITFLPDPRAWGPASEAAFASIDIPSGLDPSTGYREQPAIKADLTVTLAIPKRGLWLEPGRSSAGLV